MNYKGSLKRIWKVSAVFSLVAIMLLGPSVGSVTGQSQEGELEWYTQIEKAQELSMATGKPIFAFFTGSDWCGWCHKLQRDVFAKQEFISWAKNNVILLELDFPRRKKLPPALAAQNNELRAVFKVTGYPTIWMFKLNPDEQTGKMNIQAFGSLGYPSGAVKGKEQVKFLETANMILANVPEG